MTEQSAELATHEQLRRANLSLVLRALLADGPCPRSALAARTGLAKATVAALVTELESRGLASAGTPERNGVGRPGQVVRLDGGGVFGIGVQVNVDSLDVVAMDLGGVLLVEERIELDVPTSGPQVVLDHLAEVVATAAQRIATVRGVTVGVTVAIPALVDEHTGTVNLAPNLGWRDVPVVVALRQRLGEPDYPVRADNDANLAAIAEYAAGAAAGVPDLVYLTGAVGVGGGVISDGRLLRGAAGFAGEFGHLPLDPAGHRCGCGRTGCWETMVGLAALLRAAATPDDSVRNPALDLDQRLAEIRRRAAAGDDRTLRALQQIGTGLGLGASILVNVFDPQLIVLGGYFAALGDYLVESVNAELAARVVANGSECRVVLSPLGFTAAARGGAQVALESVLVDPTVVALRDRREAVSAGGLA
jgi:predicted NBD/HSP70 family sugar kinase